MKNQEVEGLLSMNESERILRRAEYHLEGVAEDIIRLSARYAFLRWEQLNERLLEEAAKKYGMTEEDYEISIECTEMTDYTQIESGPIKCKVRIQKKEMKQWTFETNSMSFTNRYGNTLSLGNGTATVRFAL